MKMLKFPNSDFFSTSIEDIQLFVPSNGEQWIRSYGVQGTDEPWDEWIDPKNVDHVYDTRHRLEEQNG
jgi:hypothetical protein